MDASGHMKKIKEGFKAGFSKQKAVDIVAGAKKALKVEKKLPVRVG